MHPLLGIAPHRITTDLHSLSSAWLNKHGYRGQSVPKVKNRSAWLLHNVVAHTLIGLVPCEETFRFHDETAKAMGVPNWM